MYNTHTQYSVFLENNVSQQCNAGHGGHEEKAGEVLAPTRIDEHATKQAGRNFHSQIDPKAEPRDYVH